MNVSRANFKAALERFNGIIPNCKLVSFDLEMSGLTSHPTKRTLWIDNPQDYYSKIRDSAQSFAITQFGVCLWSLNKRSGLWTSHPFNFEITTHQPLVGERVFLSQASSLKFLSQNSFDFNRWIYEGVEYMSKEEEEKVGKSPHSPGRVFVLAPTQSANPIVLTKPDDIAYVDSLKEKIKTWMDGGREERLGLPTNNSFQRRLVYELLPTYPGLIVDRQPGPPGQFIYVVSMTEEQRQAEESKLRQKAEEDFFYSIGLRHVFDRIAQSKLTIVGHNCFLDFAHILQKFERNLPEDVRDYKILLNGLFPRLMDTKYLCKTPELSPFIPDTQTALSNLYNYVKQPSSGFSMPSIDFAEDFDKYSDDQQKIFHEAGYDAYVTGCCFLALSSKFSDLQFPERVRNPVLQFVQSPLFFPHFGKMNLVGSDIVFNAVGEDKVPNRENMFLVSDLTPDVKTNHLTDHFKVFGNLRIRWVDEKSAVLVFDHIPKTIVTSNTFQVRSISKIVEREDRMVTRGEGAIVKKRKLEDSRGVPAGSSDFPEKCHIL
ncbi:poly(A)-specific ribonuclease PARN [Planoprotostelium fungivorum]|uniref:Poly(A)-specific ribonuclease PARN n=1 Tax=Planoprotostelium fungivorum TaxID=1890364 RepID=A0A2P6MYN2_9EUKA|nr:poly(A)-specific ribonuclease PARN [Planoprotostelium fungivorum]